MKFKNKTEYDAQLGDIKYKKKFALLPVETENYNVWLESYVEVWSYRYSWKKEYNFSHRILMWVKEFNLSDVELLNYYEYDKENELKQEIINNEKMSSVL